MTRTSAVLAPTLIPSPPKPLRKLISASPEERLAVLIEDQEPTPNITSQVESSLSPYWITGIRCLFDATVRGFVRFAEKFIDNNLLRVSYRLATESARKMSEISLVNVLQKQKVTKKELATAFTRALEHVPATALIEPNLFEGNVPRILAGLGNMSLRFASRLGLYKVNAITHEELGTQNVVDEHIIRSVFRFIHSDSSNSFVGIAAQILQQLFININLHFVQPVKRLFPASGELVDKLIPKAELRTD